jgi:hypothetical protein
MRPRKQNWDRRTAWTAGLGECRRCCDIVRSRTRRAQDTLCSCNCRFHRVRTWCAAASGRRNRWPGCIERKMPRNSERMMRQTTHRRFPRCRRSFRLRCRTPDCRSIRSIRPIRSTKNPPGPPCRQTDTDRRAICRCRCHHSRSRRNRESDRRSHWTCIAADTNRRSGRRDDDCGCSAQTVLQRPATGQQPALSISNATSDLMVAESVFSIKGKWTPMLRCFEEIERFLVDGDRRSGSVDPSTSRSPLPANTGCCRKKAAI